MANEPSPTLAEFVPRYDKDEPCGLAKLGINIDHPHPLAAACGVIRTIDLWEAEGLWDGIGQERADES